jgi:hypothetical protein
MEVAFAIYVCKVESAIDLPSLVKPQKPVCFYYIVDAV